MSAADLGCGAIWAAMNSFDPAKSHGCSNGKGNARRLHLATRHQGGVDGVRKFPGGVGIFVPQEGTERARFRLWIEVERPAIEMRMDIEHLLGNELGELFFPDAAIDVVELYGCWHL